MDGTEDNAGAMLTPDALRRAAGAGRDPDVLLADNRAWDFFARLDDLVVTGPTGTNANDLRIVLVNAYGAMGQPLARRAHRGIIAPGRKARRGPGPATRK